MSSRTTTLTSTSSNSRTSSSSSSTKKSSNSTATRTKQTPSTSSSATRTKQTPSTSSSSTRTRQIPSSATNKKSYELRTLADCMERAGEQLERASNYLVQAMDNLQNGLKGACATVINTITETAQDAMGVVTNFINSTGSRITADLNNQGETFTFNNTRVNTQKTGTSNNKVFSCDTNILKENVVPVLEKAKKAVTNAVEEIFNSPRVEGYESVSREAEEIDGIGGYIDNILGHVKDVIGKTEQIESKNEGVLSKIGKSVSSLLGEVVPRASAAELPEIGETQINIPNNNTNYENTSIYSANMDNSLAAQMRRDMLGQIEHLEGKKQNILANDIYNSTKDNSLAAQMARDQVAEIEKEQTDLLANYYGVDTEGKTNNEIITDVAEKIGLELTKIIQTTVPGEFEMPYFNQHLYPEGWVCCAACTAAQIASFGVGRVVDPYELVQTFPYLMTNYRTGKGTGNDWLWKLKGWKNYNLQYYSGEDGDTSNLMQNHELDKVVDILKNGGIVGLLAGPRMNGRANIFTEGGHYLTFYGVVEDEEGTRLLFIDPDGDKLTPYGEETEYGNCGRGEEEYMNYLENGISLEVLRKQPWCSYYGFKKIDENYSETPSQTVSTETNKTTDELLNELISGVSGTNSGNTIEKVTINSRTRTVTGTSNKNTPTKGSNKVNINAASNDNSLAAQIAKDKLAQEQREKEKQEGTTNNTNPNYNQLDYADIIYGGGTIADNGCGITCLAEYLTRTTGEEITPEMLANEFNNAGGTNAKRLEAALEAYGLNSQINNGGTKKSDILEALQNGKSALVLMNESSNFTTSGHYIILEGMTEEGKILVYDPNGANVENKKKYGDRFENGFDVDYVMKGLGGGYVLDNING